VLAGRGDWISTEVVTLFRLRLSTAGERVSLLVGSLLAKANALGRSNNVWQTSAHL